MAKVQTATTLATTDSRPGQPQPSTTVHWREALPVLSNDAATLREPVAADALSLLTALPDDALTQIVADPPPVTVSGLEHLIRHLQSERRAGLLACWAVVPVGIEAPVGLVGVRAIDHACSMVEGFGVIAEEFRGTPLFQTVGRMVLECLFGPMRVHRADFRVDVRNGRANGALRKLGATQEGLLRRARRADGECLDQVLWAIVSTDLTQAPAARSARIH